MTIWLLYAHIDRHPVVVSGHVSRDAAQAAGVEAVKRGAQGVFIEPLEILDAVDPPHGGG